MAETQDDPYGKAPRGEGVLLSGARWLALAWIFVSLAVFYFFFPLHRVVVWGLTHTPAWMLDLHSGWKGFPREVATQGALLVAIAWSLAALGRAAFLRFFPNEPSGSATLWGSALALGFLGFFVFLLGVAGLLGQARLLFSLLLALLVLLALAAIWSRKSVVSGNAALRLTRAEWLIVAGIAVVQIVALLYALTPSVQSDALRYHLAAPQEWLKTGRLAYLPYNAFSNFPATVEMLFLFGLGLRGDLLAKGFHFLFLPLTTGAVALLTSELVGIRARLSENRRAWQARPSILAAAAWGTLPLTVPLAGWAFIDLAIAFWCLGMVFFLMRWAQGGGRREWRLAAVFAGLLVASKHTGVPIVLFASALVVAMGCVRGSCGRALGRGVAFGLIAAAFGAPWWIKSAIETGNPVYPLAHAIFPHSGDWTAASAALYAEKLKSQGFGRGLAAFLALPWRTAALPQYFGNFEIGPLLWALLPWPLVWCLWNAWRWRSRPGEALVAVWMVFFLVFWFFTYQSNRFLLPFLALAIPASLAALGPILYGGPLRSRLCALGIALPLLYGAVKTAFWLTLDEGQIQSDPISRQWRVSAVRWPAYSLGFLDRDAYLTARVPYYGAARFCNATLSAGEKLLLVGEHRKMHFHCRVEGNDWFDSPRILPFLRNAPDADAVLDALLAAGFTHLLWNLDEWGWPTDPSALSAEVPAADRGAWTFNRRHFSPREIELLRQLLGSKRLERIYKEPTPQRLFVCRIGAMAP